jgi:hypothetical protein
LRPAVSELREREEMGNTDYMDDEEGGDSAAPTFERRRTASFDFNQPDS